LWIDSLLVGLREAGKRPDLPDVRIVIDEAPDLGELGGLKDAMAQIRKFGVEIYLGYQDPSQIQALYQEEAKAVMSAPVVGFFGRIRNAHSGKEISGAVGQNEVEAVRQHRAPDGATSFTSDEKLKDLVLPGELAGLEDRTGFITYGNYCVDIRGQLRLGLGPARSEKSVGFVPREGDAPKKLELPNLEEVKARDEAKRQRDTERLAAGVFPSQRSAANGGTASMASGEESAAKDGNGARRKAGRANSRQKDLAW
jgi:hypothetical protein